MKSCLHYTERQFVEKEIKKEAKALLCLKRERETERQGMGLAIFKHYLQCCTPVYRAHTVTR